MDKELKYSKYDTSLSKKRTLLAGMRTFLSHIRTSLVFISVALAFMKLDKEHPIDIFTILLFVFSAFFLIIGIVDYFLTRKMVSQFSVEYDN